MPIPQSIVRAARRTAATLLVLGMVCTDVVAAGLIPDRFLDPQDGELDLSEWLLDRKGFLPIPVLITEPALGYGGGLFAMFFSESMRDAAARAKGGRVDPPNIYGLGAFGTENGSWGAAGGGMVSFGEGRYRWRGGVGRASVNLDFYGVGGKLGPVGYNLDGWFSSQQGMMRLGESDNWLVARWNYFDLTNTFDAPGQAGQFGDIVRSSRDSGLGLGFEHDSRDNIFTPNQGWVGSVDLTFYDPDWGSDTRFQSYRGHVFSYWPLSKAFVLGGRVDARMAEGDVPFYLLPAVELRGVPAMRLQDTRTGVIETELRWNMTPRWALVGFLGAGRAWGSRNDFSDGTDTVTKGGGFRYLIASRLGLYVGVDLAWSTQDKAWYIQVGNAWR
jgi:hypothetical protein